MVWVRRRGNFAADRGDYGCMACERWREMLSAQLDGEDDPAGRPLVDEHLAGCAGCREWLDRAATVNRLTRTAGGVPGPAPSAGIAAAPPPAPPRGPVPPAAAPPPPPPAARAGSPPPRPG